MSGTEGKPGMPGNVTPWASTEYVAHERNARLLSCNSPLKEGSPHLEEACRPATAFWTAHDNEESNATFSNEDFSML